MDLVEEWGHDCVCQNGLGSAALTNNSKGSVASNQFLTPAMGLLVASGASAPCLLTLGPRMTVQLLSETMPVITSRWKENSWRVSCWYLNVLAQKYHKSLLLTSHWLEQVTWPQLTLRVFFMCPHARGGRGVASISKARLSQELPQIPLWPEAGPMVTPP